MKIPQEYQGLSKRDLVRLLIHKDKEVQEMKLEVQKIKLELEKITKILLAYENAHTPPSQQRNYPKREKSNNKIGAPVGHKGVTRETPKPTETKKLSLSSCPNCSNKLGKPKRIERRIIEEISDPQPLRVIEFFIPHYHCTNCNKEIIANDPELPREGRLGNNLQAEITLMRYEDRLPCRKIIKTLKRKYKNIHLSPATILDVTRRVADTLTPNYGNIKQEILESLRVNADETGAKLNGKKHWLWLFINLNSVLFLLRKRRNHKVIIEVLGKEYHGILTCDGLKQYQKIVKIIQRCWAHLLREAKFLAQKHEGQARVTYNSLCELFEEIKKVTLKTPMKTRKKLHDNCIKKMQLFIRIADKYAEWQRI